VRVGTKKKEVAVAVCSVGVGVSLGVGVVVSLGGDVDRTVCVSVGVLDITRVGICIPPHKATPDKPSLYASNTINNLTPTSLSPSDTWLPIGCLTSHP